MTPEEQERIQACVGEIAQFAQTFTYRWLGGACRPLRSCSYPLLSKN